MCDYDRSIWALRGNDVLGFYCLDKTLTKPNWEGKSFFPLNVFSQSSKDVREGTQSQNLEEGTKEETVNKCGLLACFHACSTMFSIQPRTISSGWLHPQWLDCSRQSLIPQTSPCANQEEVFSWLKFFFPRCPWLLWGWGKTKQNNRPAHYTRGSLPIQLDMGEIIFSPGENVMQPNRKVFFKILRD